MGYQGENRNINPYNFPRCPKSDLVSEMAQESFRTSELGPGPKKEGWMDLFCSHVFFFGSPVTLSGFEFPWFWMGMRMTTKPIQLQDQWHWYDLSTFLRSYRKHGDPTPASWTQATQPTLKQKMEAPVWGVSPKIVPPCNLNLLHTTYMAYVSS